MKIYFKLGHKHALLLSCNMYIFFSWLGTDTNMKYIFFVMKSHRFNIKPIAFQFMCVYVHFCNNRNNLWGFASHPLSPWALYSYSGCTGWFCTYKHDNATLNKLHSLLLAHYLYYYTIIYYSILLYILQHFYTKNSFEHIYPDLFMVQVYCM